MENQFRRLIRSGTVLLFLLFLSGCAELGDLFQKPTARIESVELVEADFTSVTLQVNVEIDNPNSVGITLSAYDYRLSASGKIVVEGSREEPVSLRAQDSSIIPIPVRVGFSELAALGTAVISDNVIPVNLGLGLEITFPYMGTARLDISGEGEIPVLRPPIIRPASIKVEQITLTGADILLIANVENPNGFDLTINKAEGRLFVAGQEWGVIQSQSGRWIPSGKNIAMNTRMKVDFSEVGRSAWSLLTGSGDAEVNVAGEMDVDLDLPGFNGSGIPWDVDAKVSILRGD